MLAASRVGGLAKNAHTGPSALLADALAPAAMVLGPKAGLELVEALPDCKAYLVSKDLTSTKTDDSL